MKNNIAEKINSPAHLLREFARFLAALAVLATLTYAGFILHAESLIVGFLYLTMVAMVALYCGFWQATTISVLAVAMLDYFFLAPLFSFLAIYLTPPGPTGCGFTSFTNGTGSI